MEFSYGSSIWKARISRSGIVIAAIVSAELVTAQTSSSAAKREPDVLLFTDGEKLIGTLERSDGNSVVFKSNMAGEITVDWSKIKELHSLQHFAVAKKGVTFGRGQKDVADVPQGTVSMADETIEIEEAPPSPPERVPVADAAYLINEEAFEKALQKPGFFEYWKGAASFGASLVLATQNDRNFTSNVALVRNIPVESWREPENRTLVNFSSSFGQLNQPNQPRVKTSIFHANVERDEYYRERFYVFVDATFDHNYSQGLDLQQSYGSGIGWTVLKNANEALDLRAEATYVHQQFQDAAQNQELFGSIWSEAYKHKFRRNVVLNEQLSISPSWNNLNAYSANANMSLTIPVFKRVGLVIGALDTFLNNPSPGFKKNSFQFTTSASYAIP